MRHLLALSVFCFLLQAQDKPHEWHWVSPSGRLHADAKFVDADTPREIFLSEAEAPEKKQLLCTFERDARVLISPDEKWIALNDHLGSNASEIRIFKRASGLSFVETSLDPGVSAWYLLKRSHKVPYPKILFHTYANVYQWSADSSALLIWLEGHNDQWQHVDDWLCVYDIQTRKSSFNLSLMNRGSVIYKSRANADKK